MRNWKRYLWVLVLVVVFSLGIATSYFYFQKNQATLTSIKTEAEKDVYLKFLSEVYDKIKENYWESLTDEQLGNLFKLGIEKLTNKPQDDKIKDKTDFLEMSENIMKIVKPDKKKEFVTQLTNLVLTNLKPAGRSALYTVQDKENLANKVRNINPETDLYLTLGLGKDASEEEVDEAYQNKLAELSRDDSQEAQNKLELIKYAYQILSNTGQKENYDQAGIEPTVFAKLVRPNILHLYIKKMSPATLDELKKETEKNDNKDGLDTLILDLRANIGGSIDILPYLLGPFIGKNQYAFEFFHQEEYTPFKTKTGWLPSLIRYKKVVILIDDQTQSSAEVMAATLKKYNVGITVGTTTKGWGTIESVINIDQRIDPNEKYSIFLVHSLTLREDNQPIQGNGINPLISINDLDWEQQLSAYFDHNELIKAVKEVWNKSPGKF